MARIADLAPNEKVKVGKLIAEVIELRRVQNEKIAGHETLLQQHNALLLERQVESAQWRAKLKECANVLQLADLKLNQFETFQQQTRRHDESVFSSTSTTSSVLHSMDSPVIKSRQLPRTELSHEYEASDQPEKSAGCENAPIVANTDSFGNQNLSPRRPRRQSISPKPAPPLPFARSSCSSSFPPPPSFSSSPSTPLSTLTPSASHLSSHMRSQQDTTQSPPARVKSSAARSSAAGTIARLRRLLLSPNTHTITHVDSGARSPLSSSSVMLDFSQAVPVPQRDVVHLQSPPPSSDKIVDDDLDALDLLRHLARESSNASIHEMLYSRVTSDSGSPRSALSPSPHSRLIAQAPMPVISSRSGGNVVGGLGREIRISLDRDDEVLLGLLQRI